MRLNTIAAAVAGAILLSGAPSHAATLADFDGDGVLDTVDLQAPGRSTLAVSLSNSPREVLHLTEPAVAVATTDFDHDGKPDISALTKSRRLLVWLNRGRHGFSLLRRHRTATPLQLWRVAMCSSYGSNQPPATGQPKSPMPDGVDVFAHPEQLHDLIAAISSPPERPCSLVTAARRPSRAPPLLDV